MNGLRMTPEQLAEIQKRIAGSARTVRPLGKNAWEDHPAKTRAGIQKARAEGKRPKKKPNYSDLFESQLRKTGVPVGVREFYFHPVRRWRFDFAWADGKIALEIDGGIFINGRHNRASGFLKDMEKMNAAAELGWRVFHVTPEQVKKGRALELIERILLV